MKNDPSSSQIINKMKNTRIELAAAFRWAAKFGMNEGIANHFSVTINDDGSHFLMNPKGIHWSRMRASHFLVLDANNKSVMDQPSAPDPTAWYIHGSIHRMLPHARCLMHVHSKYATVFSTFKNSVMPPIDNNTMRYFDRIAYDTVFEGMAINSEEGDRLARLIGNKPILVMGNHGLLVIGKSVVEAFDDLYYFERACETLILAYATGQELKIVSDQVAKTTAQQWQNYPDLAENHFSELMRILDQSEPDYRD